MFDFDFPYPMRYIYVFKYSGFYQFSVDLLISFMANSERYISCCMNIIFDEKNSKTSYKNNKMCRPYQACTYDNSELSQRDFEGCSVQPLHRYEGNQLIR